MNGARRWLAPFVGETLFPPRGPFSKVRVAARGAHVAACGDERQRGNLAVSPKVPSPHRLESSR